MHASSPKLWAVARLTLRFSASRRAADSACPAPGRKRRGDIEGKATGSAARLRLRFRHSRGLPTLLSYMGPPPSGKMDAQA
ncbi:hypothetical protein USDA257_c41930 [Sinorhizobium fredii USDA 257]|uniref:Uncharacterized protein n=1 Tax=Sinorhizobium fredii (strain USDA 257) TaxID=1185652 RepID=I3XA27_SINF2|nr:hypothetical protein USDA257_c41930 [Sinorhizobium fredii USDA 257]